MMVKSEYIENLDNRKFFVNKFALKIQIWWYGCMFAVSMISGSIIAERASD